MRKFILLCAIFISTSALAQQKATTADGKEVLLNPDGTWQYLVSPSGAKSGEAKRVLATENLDAAKTEATPTESTPAAPAKPGTLSGENTATGKDIYVGPRGGHYHYSPSGRKVYERHRK